jgi:hypothetical protein
MHAENAANILICRDEVRRTSSVCSDSARRSADLRQVEVRQALAARQRVDAWHRSLSVTEAR